MAVDYTITSALPLDGALVFATLLLPATELTRTEFTPDGEWAMIHGTGFVINAWVTLLPEKARRSGVDHIGFRPEWMLTFRLDSQADLEPQRDVVLEVMKRFLLNYPDDAQLERDGEVHLIRKHGVLALNEMAPFWTYRRRSRLARQYTAWREA